MKFNYSIGWESEPRTFMFILAISHKCFDTLLLLIVSLFYVLCKSGCKSTGFSVIEMLGNC